MSDNKLSFKFDNICIEDPESIPDENNKLFFNVNNDTVILSFSDSDESINNSEDNGEVVLLPTIIKMN